MLSPPLSPLIPQSVCFSSPALLPSSSAQTSPAQPEAEASALPAADALDLPDYYLSHRPVRPMI